MARLYAKVESVFELVSNPATKRTLPCAMMFSALNNLSELGLFWDSKY